MRRYWGPPWTDFHQIWAVGFFHHALLTYGIQNTEMQKSFSWHNHFSTLLCSKEEPGCFGTKNCFSKNERAPTNSDPINFVLKKVIYSIKMPQLLSNTCQLCGFIWFTCIHRKNYFVGKCLKISWELYWGDRKT